MKKALLTLALAASVLAAQADVTVFKAQGAPDCRYHGTADQTVEMYSGFTFRFHGQTYQRVDENLSQSGFIEKEAPSDRVQLWGVHMDGVASGNNAISCDHVLAGSLRMYATRSYLITPAEGLTVTKLVFKGKHGNDTKPASFAVVEPNGAEYNVLNNFSYNSNDSSFTMTGNYNKPFYVINNGTGEFRAFFVEVTTTGTSNQVAIPEYSIKHNMVAENEGIELTCATPGAKIYYTIDEKGVWNGTRVGGGVRSLDPTPETGTLYTAPIKLENDAIIRAIAVKDGMASSFQTYKEFYVMPEYDQVAVFNFNDFTSIKDADGNQIANFATYPVVDTNVSSGTTQSASLALNEAVDKNVTFCGTVTNEASGAGCDLTLSNTFGGVVELRPKNGSNMYITALDDAYLTAVYVEAARPEFLSFSASNPGTWRDGFTTICQKVWRADSKDCYEVSMDVTGDNQYVDRIYAFYAGVTPTGIDNVTVNENAPAEYFNLQGIRVANPAKGQIVIKRQGSKATKVVF